MEQFDDQFDIGKLISGYLKDDLTEKEARDLYEWLNSGPERQAQFDKLTAENKLKNDHLTYLQSNKAAAWTRVAKKTGYKSPKKRPIPWTRFAAAACVLVILSAGGYFIINKNNGMPQNAQNRNDIAPGGNKAILISHGKTYNINDIKNGQLIRHGQTVISKSPVGQLVYTETGDGSSGTMGYDTLIIPRGGQYRLKLNDGSIVYLNADSRLRYPENFTGNERKVELISGEAYFEVVHNRKMPFRVATKSQVVEDIGTHFNINAYNDEPSINTTLLEGSIKLHKGSVAVILKPGQQAVNPSHATLTVHNVDVEETIAWKNGMFRFNGTPLASIMDQVSRWYDVDVVYQNDALKTQSFIAISTRFAKVSQLLNYLEEAGNVKFRVEGKKITVLNK